MDKVAAIFNEKLQGRGCPLCRGHKFTNASLFFYSGIDRRSDGVASSVLTPTLRLFCSNCGFIIHLGAIVLGIADVQGNLTLPRDSPKPSGPKLTLITGGKVEEKNKLK